MEFRSHLDLADEIMSLLADRGSPLAARKVRSDCPWPSPLAAAMPERVKAALEESLLLGKVAASEKQRDYHRRNYLQYDGLFDEPSHAGVYELEEMRLQRDEAIEHAQRLEHRMSLMMEQRDESMLALAEERADKEAAEAMFSDCVEHLQRLSSKNALLEKMLLQAQLQACRDTGLAQERRGGGDTDEAFGLTHTRAAIERAVAEAAKLPEEERKKKLRALRLKWHPDKHDVLKEMANEVSKMINEAVQRLEAENEPTD